LLLIVFAISRDSAAKAYTDQALTRGEPEDEARLELLASAPQPQRIKLLQSDAAANPHAALAASDRPRA